METQESRGRGHGIGDRFGFFDAWSGMIDYQWRSVMRHLEKSLSMFITLL